MYLPPERLELLQEWDRRCRRNLDTHAWAEQRLDRWNVVAALLSIGSLVALGVAASAFDLTAGTNRYWAVGLAVVGAVASVLLTLREYGSKAAAHRSAGRQYGALGREIEQLVRVELASVQAFEDRINEIRRRWDWIADVAPNAPRRIRDQADKKQYSTRYV